MIVLLIVVVTALLASPRDSSAGDSNKALEDALKSKYDLTKTGIDRVRITKPGTVLVIQKENISGDLASDATFLTNKVENGDISQAKGFGAVLQDKKTSRVFKAGEKVYVFKLEVKDKAVEFFLVSCETYDVNVHGSSRQTRYKSLLSFEFPEGFLATADADTVKKTVDAIIVPEQEAKAASTKTVQIGQTPEEVEGILGRPDKIVDLGAKKVYIYKDMKIIFADGKVADVQ
jgi:hypothetical protein